jgi:glycosyltransferase involved in cell wall biosynthesis
MNILHISSPISWRGGEQQLAYLIEELSKQNTNQFVLCSKGSALETYCIKNKIVHIALRKKSAVNPFTAKEIKGICKKFTIDLMHAHDSHAHTAAFLSAFLFGNKTPLVLSRKVDFPLHSGWLSKLKYNHHTIKKIICVSNKVKEVLDPYITDKSILTIIYDGIDMSRFANVSHNQKLRNEFGISTSSILVGNIAAIAPHKDYYTFVDTVEILFKQRLDARYFIIGDGKEKADIEAYIEKKGLQKQIIFTGFRNDVQSILPELDIFLMTSKTEGLGSSILDAYACKVPVVATVAGGIPEIVINKKTGLLAEIQDPQGLAENVLSILNNTELRDNLIRNATEYLKQFSKEKMGLETYKVYHEILKCTDGFN